MQQRKYSYGVNFRYVRFSKWYQRTNGGSESIAWPPYEFGLQIATLSTIDLCYCLLLKTNQLKRLMNNVEIPTDFIQVGLSFAKFLGPLLVFQKSS